MSFHKLLIANRGEIAIRIARAAGDAGLATVAIHSADDAQSLHVRTADAAHEIPGRGARAYLDIEAVIAAAKTTGCDAVHPGYGFLSENATLARRCIEESIVFVGPSPEALDLFGDKAQAKALAKQCGVPIIEGTSGPTSLEEARAFLESLGAGGAIMIKAIAGGGGRGMRIVDDANKLEEAYARCQSEAMAAFGSDGVYVERLIRNARHIEVQIICDRYGAISHLWERECTIQRRNQKLIEVAPSPSLNEALRGRIIDAAKELAAAANYDNLGTFEFLVDNDAKINEKASDQAFAFIEANPRLQVEHTVTEEVLGLDLVQSQLAVAAGATLGSLGLAQAYIPKPRGYAMQLRVNMEVMDETGGTKPTGGTLALFDLPSGPGVRVDTFGYSGYRTSTAFDSLLAKVIVHSPGGNWTDVVHKASRTLREFRVGGVATNIPFLAAILAHPDFVENRVSTGFIEAHVADLVGEAKATAETALIESGNAADDETLALAVAASATGPDGSVAVPAPLQGTIVAIDVEEGDLVRPGQQIAVLESMKMEHLVTAPHGGRVTKVAAEAGATLMQDEAILYLEPAEIDAHDVAEEEDVDLDHIRPDLAELIERHAITLDENRPASVERRRKTNQRTARENIAQLVDDGSFVEYGSLAIAAQRRRRAVDDLIRNTPADGLISGVATVNAQEIRRGRRPLHGDFLRLHRAGRHPGPHEPQEDRPHAEFDRAMAVAAGVLRGGWRRPARRHRPARHDRPRRAVLRAIRKAFRAGAGHRRRVRLLLCRQRRDARLLRRHHRDEERLDRHGRPRDDRRRRPRRLPSGRSRSGVVPVAEWRHRHPGRGRGGSDGCCAKIPVVLPGRGRRLEGARPAPVAPGDPGKPPAGLRHPNRHRSSRGRRLGAGNPQRLWRRHDHRLHPHRGQSRSA